MKRHVLLAVGVFASLVGCTSPWNFVACTADARAGVTLEVRGPGGNGLAGVVITLKDGPYTETIKPLDSHFASGASERPGTYEITVEKAGYKTFQKSGVVVEKDQCHVITVNVPVQLEPLP